MKTFHVCGAKTCLIFLAILLAASGCAGPLSVNESSTGQESNLALPTPRPTTAPSPVSTRVVPLDSLTPAPTPTITPIPAETLGLVVDVLSGDTIAVVLNGDPARLAYQVKYLGIDAPPNSSEEPWGVVAYETNHKLANLKVVKLVRDQTDFDDEGYLLRYVYVGNRLLNTELVAEGLARAAVTPPNTRLESEILQAEAEAKADRLGIWGAASPTPTPGSKPSPVATTTQTAEAKTPPASVTLTVTTTSTVTTTVTTTATTTPAPTAEPSVTATATASPTASATSSGSSSGLQGPS